MADGYGIAVQHHGGKGPPLVLLHGLGATGAVWTSMLRTARDHWRGSIISVDLPGHGGSAHLAAYGFDDFAAALAPAIAAEADGAAVTILGHSLGGVLALVLADPRFGLPVTAVLGLGIKTIWTEEELARFAAQAARPTRWFDDEPSALAQHARMCGLADLDPALLARGVMEENGTWRLALDSRVLAVERPPLAELTARASGTIHLARGEADPMNHTADLRRFDNEAISLPGAAHNAMVDQPGQVWAWVATRAIG